MSAERPIMIDGRLLDTDHINQKIRGFDSRFTSVFSNFKGIDQKEFAEPEFIVEAAYPDKEQPTHVVIAAGSEWLKVKAFGIRYIREDGNAIMKMAEFHQGKDPLMRYTHFVWEDGKLVSPGVVSITLDNNNGARRSNK